MRSFLKKAENFNLSQSTNLLHKSFLRNRTPCVKMGFGLSDKTTINHGVPHANLFFSVICKQFYEKLEGENDNVQFADDTSILFKIEKQRKYSTTNLQIDKYLTRESTQFNCR